MNQHVDAPLDLSLQAAQHRDAQDPLAELRQEFHFPTDAQGRQLLYLCGNSLGLQPRGVFDALKDELDDWARLGVEAHFEGKHPWYDYHEPLSAPLARIVGALPHEVVAMNALTVNLHLMMLSFYQPDPTRFKIIIEGGAFPSDQYAVASQAKLHGFDPAQAIIELHPKDGEHTLNMDDVEQTIREHGSSVALVMLGGVNYYTGQAMDIARITRVGHEVGAFVGFDLAHAAGNLELSLHDDGPDFAVWCSYKYLNSGPGGVAGCFVHDRHANNPSLPRLAGWWGNDPKVRFQMPSEFEPQNGAAGWQLSNAPILSMAALRASLALFDRAQMPRLRQKGVALTEYLLALIDTLPDDAFEIITPRDPAMRGCQLSLRARAHGPELFEALKTQGVTCDFRRPDVIRVAPAPLYNSFEDVWRFHQALKLALEALTT